MNLRGGVKISKQFSCRSHFALNLAPPPLTFIGKSLCRGPEDLSLVRIEGFLRPWSKGRCPDPLRF